MISWFRHGQQKQLSHLEQRDRHYFPGSVYFFLFWREFQILNLSPEGPVCLDDDLVAAVGDGHLEGALLVAALELKRFDFSSRRFREAFFPYSVELLKIPRKLAL